MPKRKTTFLLIFVIIFLGGIIITTYMDYLDHVKVVITPEMASRTAKDYLTMNTVNGDKYNITQPVLERYNAHVTLRPQLVWKVYCYYYINNLSGSSVDIYVDPYSGQIFDVVWSIS